MLNFIHIYALDNKIKFIKKIKCKTKELNNKLQIFILYLLK